MLAHEILPEAVWEAEFQQQSRWWMEWFTGMSRPQLKARWPVGSDAWIEVSRAFQRLRDGVTNLSCCTCRRQLECTTADYLHAMLQYNAPHQCERAYVTRT